MMMQNFILECSAAATKKYIKLGKLPCLSLLCLSLIAACGGDSGGSGGSADNEEPVADFLVASGLDFYFGTRGVGTTSTQTIELSNRSGDIYPIHGLQLLGENAEEFQTSFIGELTLNPTEQISIDVTFAPLTDGQKVAALNIDYDIIQQVTRAANLNEQNFYKAEALEAHGDFEKSADTYKDYLAGKPATINKREASIKFPVLSESESHGDGADFKQYLSAVNKREKNDHLGAIISLNKLLVEEPDSIYADDALYMRGYIQLLDTGDHAGARDTMAQLRSQYPDSKYYDTALFSEGMANEELGEPGKASGLYMALKDRHTSEAAKYLSLDLPKDNYLSRLWFDRAKQGLSRSRDIKKFI